MSKGTGSGGADKSILMEAEELTNGARNADYGHPLDDYGKTAKMWSGLLAGKLKEDITPEEAMLCMCCVKISREVNKPKRDNLVDLAGYANCVSMCQGERERRAAEDKD